MIAERPVSILIGALGGEGGGVLAGWVTRAAEIGGYPVQRTSIPGVAQRTGATTYYIEMSPVPRTGREADVPVLALAPVPGEIDLMVASELLEAARAVQNGLIDPKRTTLIASSHRIYTVLEKAAMAEGRVDDASLRRLVTRFARRAILFDMEAIAREAGTVISAVMLGAIAGGDVVPLERAACEAAIRESGKGVEASLRGFALGFAATRAAAEPAHGGVAPETTMPSAIEGAEDFPPAVRTLVAAGYRRQLDFQGRRYAELYLDRVRRVLVAERATEAAPEYPVTAAVARFLALWMSYEDVIRVADLKSRHERMRRIRNEANAGDHDIVRVIEYMKPGLEEWCAVLPAGIARRLRDWAERRGRRLNVGLHIRTDSLHGFLLLRLLAGLRGWRPYTLRYAEEQALIERWLGEVLAALARAPILAHEIALCARLIKGYSDTHARGKANFLNILELLARPGEQTAAEQAQAVREAREAALADPGGEALARTLRGHGVAPSVPKAVPVQWHKRAPRVAAPGRVR